MKIAFATDDRKTVAERTGRAKEFAVYETEGSEIVNIEFLENTHKHHHDEHKHGMHGDGYNRHHGNGHSHKEIVDMIRDVDFLFVKRVGKHMKEDLENAGINYVKTGKNEISEILKEFLKK